jgi:hypothetical protein
MKAKPSALKREHPALQKKLNFFTFYIFVPDPDPNFQCASGFTMQRRYAMNGRSQMQGGKKLKCKPVLLRLSLAGNLEKPLCSSTGPNGGSVAMDSEL